MDKLFTNKDLETLFMLKISLLSFNRSAAREVLGNMISHRDRKDLE